MLKWLVEKRFIRRANVGTVSESWDDETPSWVDAAQSASGVSFSTNKTREPTEATFGFQRASSITISTPESFEVEALDTRYEATAMGERVAQLLSLIHI